MRAQRIAILGVVAWLALAAGARADVCSLGRAVDERVLIRPRAGSFYSVDALNPDVLRFRGRWLMFFSGNDTHTYAGDWHTGLASARRLARSWRVDRRVRLPWLNGGSAVRGGRVFMLATPRTAPNRPVLYASRDAQRWRLVSRMPVAAGAQVTDAFLRAEPGGLRAYVRLAAGQAGADIATVTFRDGRWSSPRVVLRRSAGWDRFDLGEPAVFRAGTRTLMTYTGVRDDVSRDIGLAVRERVGWRRCPAGPLIRSGGGGWYARNAIDPSPVVSETRLYLFYGGGDQPSLVSDMHGTIGVRVYRLAH